MTVVKLTLLDHFLDRLLAGRGATGGLMEKTLVSGQERKKDRPEVHWVAGQCPCCGESTVINYYHQGGKGYVGYEECWASLGEGPTCEYRRVR